LDARLVSDKLLSIALHPIPLLGLGLTDKLKLVFLSLLASFTLPFLLIGDDSYSRATGVARRAAPKDITIRTDYGVFFCKTYDDFFTLWPSYEGELRSFFMCEANLVFMDVGAHAGRYTVMLGREIDRVIAIEPNSENFRGLQRNMELNGLKNVSLLKYACWDKSGLGLDLFLSSTTFRHSVTRPQERSEHVETITLDQVLQDLRIEPTDVGLVKIDAEGAEVQIFKGGKKLFSAGRPRIIFESFPQDVAIKGEILRSYGYRRIRRVGEINYVAEKWTTYEAFIGRGPSWLTYVRVSWQRTSLSASVLRQAMIRIEQGRRDCSQVFPEALRLQVTGKLNLVVPKV